ncbi:peptidase inhibitor family I36 protein [Egibacter rhizosphaerae]|uniref:peptidase inhibitor family I36 protein n=1 Tax=Egibacter rhizosphaerae TaxID=1670831 RepID=UPI0013F16C35|nr:peptidase inhibitor family I36 protein [Egibacter rhizosphaerae]
MHTFDTLTLRRLAAPLVGACLALLFTMATAGSAAASDAADDPISPAGDDGAEIDLAEEPDWGGAEICYVTDESTTCFESLREFAQHHAEHGEQRDRELEALVDDPEAVDEPGVAAASCPSGAYCLYSSTGFSGQQLVLSTSSGCQALSQWSFENRAQSWVNNRSGVVGNYRSAYSCSGAGFAANAFSSDSNMGIYRGRISRVDL